MTNKTVSIIGCGWLGLPLAEQLLACGYIVKGSATTEEKVTALNKLGIDAYHLQLNPEPIGNLTALLQADTLIINIPPKAGKMGDAFHPQQLEYIANAIRQSSIGHVIYVSSTSVYTELSKLMLETNVTSLQQSAAPALIKAELLVQKLAPRRLVTVVRCGGLMGYDRVPGKYVTGRTVDSGAVPVNYLHRDDAVGILQQLVSHDATGVFNAVAPEHPTREAIYRKSCTEFGYQLPTFISPAEPLPYKIISGQKLIQNLTYTFKYPDPLQFFYNP